MITYDLYKPENYKPVVGAVTFPTRSEAEFVLDSLIFEADLFNRACLHSFYTACLIVPDEEDRSLGWTKEEVISSTVCCRRALGFTEYRITLPIPHPIETIEPYSIIPIWEDGHVVEHAMEEIAKKTSPIIEGGDTNE